MESAKASPIVHRIPLNELYLGIVRAAVAMVNHLMLDLSTDYSRKVYLSNILDTDELQNMLQRLVKSKPNDLFELNAEELMLLYTCSFIANCHAQDKKEFFQWFLKNDQGEIADSTHLRNLTLDHQMGASLVIERSHLWNEALQKRKDELIRCFGELRDQTM